MTLWFLINKPMGIVACRKQKYREYLFEKQNGLCHYCKTLMDMFCRTHRGHPGRAFPTFEHLKRREDGGHFTAENIVLAHRKCNAKKNDEDIRAKRAAREARLSEQSTSLPPEQSDTPSPC